MPDARTIFAAVDSLDPHALAPTLASNATMVFGNGDPMIGREAILAGSEAFLTTVKSVSHQILNEWTIDADTIAEASVTYTRLDGKEVTIPVVSIWRVNPDDKITHYRVFVDLTPVYTP